MGLECRYRRSTGTKWPGSLRVIVAACFSILLASRVGVLSSPVLFALPSTDKAASAVQQDVDIVRRAVSTDSAARPDQADVLGAILRLQRTKTELNSQKQFLAELTGGGKAGGKRWKLVYLATKDAVISTRKRQSPPSWLDRGWYVDGFVTAVQRFEDSSAKRINQNGVFEFLGLGGFFFGYFARFKWPSPEKRTTLGFQPVTNNVRAFGLDWAEPFADGFPAGKDGDSQFEKARLQDLNIFNFLYVDEHAAVAQGASGSIALWGETDAAWDAEHLIDVPEA
mmetsp:Transcript_34278/g.80121  ORF Transcript_34278/g.80121 Transcript_34278/m.80121 type:complete len:282 (+) Transcript_34278:30-875(+)